MSDINKLIEQIGGRNGLEEILAACKSFSEEERKTGGKADLQNWLDIVHPGNTELMARALLAVLDAKPVAILDHSGAFYDFTRVSDESLPNGIYKLYTAAPPAMHEVTK